MLGLMRNSAALVPVDEDEVVKHTTEQFIAAHATLTECEAEEARQIRAVQHKDTVTDEELDAAREQLQISKGTQCGWYSPRANLARTAFKRADDEHREAKAAARDRLRKAGTAQMATLTQELVSAIAPARRVATELEELRQFLTANEIKHVENPGRLLLRDELLDVHLRNAKAWGWIT